MAATSGMQRLFFVVFPLESVTLVIPASDWYEGTGKFWLGPPPLAPAKPPTGVDESALLQTTSVKVTGGPVLTEPMTVPPTDVTQGSLPG